MTNSLYYLLFAFILFTSCKDEDDTIPQSFLSGTYEIATENTNSGVWYISQYIFKLDGTYEQLGLMRESQFGSALGYTSLGKGTYSLRGEEFVTNLTEVYLVNFENFPDGYAENLADLEKQELQKVFAESKGILKKLENGAKISIVFECNDMLTGKLSMCIGERVYDRVD